MAPAGHVTLPPQPPCMRSGARWSPFSRALGACTRKLCVREHAAACNSASFRTWETTFMAPHEVGVAAEILLMCRREMCAKFLRLHIAREASTGSSWSATADVHREHILRWDVEEHRST